MSTRDDIDLMFEAASGDRIGDVEPVFIGLRGSGADILLVDVRVDDRAMTATYQILDPKLDRDDVLVLFCTTYLRTLTLDFWRERVDTITLVPRDGSAPASSFAYPTWPDDDVEET